jgi:hypothetical protein
MTGLLGGECATATITWARNRPRATTALGWPIPSTTAVCAVAGRQVVHRIWDVRPLRADPWVLRV